MMSEKCYRKEFIGCFGMPVDENPTVVVMDAAFRAMGLDYLYNASLVRPEDLGAAVAAVRALGWKGANTTVPHKIEVMKYLDRIEPDAALIGAVNTLYWDNGQLVGANTDGTGFVVSLREAGMEPAGKRFAILGAGGAAKAVSVELALAGAKKITVVNRTAAKAEALAALIRGRTAAQAEARAWDGPFAVPADADFLINCTNIGLLPDPNTPDVDWSTVRPELIVCDVIPNPPHTRFLAAAEARGCRTFDGLSMLVNQAATNIRLFTGKTPPTDVMKAALAAEFAGAAKE